MAKTGNFLVSKGDEDTPLKSDYVVRSKFIKNLIKEKRFSSRTDRVYISNLIDLEDGIVHPWGFPSALGYEHRLKERYRKEWEAIYKELKPEEFKKVVLKEQSVKKEAKAYEKEMAEEEKKVHESFKRQWLKFGGKL